MRVLVFALGNVNELKLQSFSKTNTINRFTIKIFGLFVHMLDIFYHILFR